MLAVAFPRGTRARVGALAVVICVEAVIVPAVPGGPGRAPAGTSSRPGCCGLIPPRGLVVTRRWPAPRGAAVGRARSCQLHDRAGAPPADRGRARPRSARRPRGRRGPHPRRPRSRLDPRRAPRPAAPGRGRPRPDLRRRRPRSARGRPGQRSAHLTGRAPRSWSPGRAETGSTWPMATATSACTARPARSTASKPTGATGSTPAAAAGRRASATGGPQAGRRRPTPPSNNPSPAAAPTTTPTRRNATTRRTSTASSAPSRRAASPGSGQTSTCPPTSALSKTTPIYSTKATRLGHLAAERRRDPGAGADRRVHHTAGHSRFRRPRLHDRDVDRLSQLQRDELDHRHKFVPGAAPLHQRPQPRRPMRSKGMPLLRPCSSDAPTVLIHANQRATGAHFVAAPSREGRRPPVVSAR
jgi:hypothetical protein